MFVYMRMHLSDCLSCISLHWRVSLLVANTGVYAGYKERARGRDLTDAQLLVTPEVEMNFCCMISLVLVFTPKERVTWKDFLSDISQWPNNRAKLNTCDSVGRNPGLC